MNQPPELIATEQIRTDAKKFFFDLKANERGIVLRLTEDVRGRRNTIMVPLEALRETGEICLRLADYAESLA